MSKGIDSMSDKEGCRLRPKEGLLTFMAEGNNIKSSRHYSRKIHWPGNSLKCDNHSSGVTIGRGYDMRYRTHKQIIKDLMLAGVEKENAKSIAEGSGKFACLARDFVIENKNKLAEITEQQQLKLFNLTYKKYLSDSIRFYNKYKRIDSVSWQALLPVLKDVFVDMKYQGVLSYKMVPIFGLNRRDKLIVLIQETPTLINYESRGRIAYIEGSIK